ncbi:hypothetical protein HDU80_005556 [Chytriomyces hyalinus]|nr:hypothetical protein HDU80_005556 [Chytriomyces hyalinus]
MPIFSPSVDVTQWPSFSISHWQKLTGVNSFILAGVTANHECIPSFLSRPDRVAHGPRTYYTDEAIQSRVQIGISFGATDAHIRDLSACNDSPASLAASYASVLDAFNSTHIDVLFASRLSVNASSVAMRAEALALLQTGFEVRRSTNLTVTLSFESASVTDGLDPDAIAVVQAVHDAGVLVHSVNVALKEPPLLRMGLAVPSNEPTSSVRDRDIKKRGFKSHRVHKGINTVNGQLLHASNQDPTASSAGMKIASAVKKQMNTFSNVRGVMLVPVLASKGLQFTTADAVDLMTWAETQPWLSFGLSSANADAEGVSGTRKSPVAAISQMSSLIRIQTVSILLILVALFVPVWWSTTQVHRAVLPTDQIRALAAAEAKNVFHTRVAVRFVSGKGQPKAVAESLQTHLNNLFGGASFHFAVRADTSTEETQSTSGLYQLRIDCGVKNIQGEGSVKLFEDRVVSLQTPAECADTESIVAQAVAVVGGLFLDERADFARISGSSSHNNDDIRKVKFAPEYQLIFNLMNADPVNLLVSWDIQAAIKDYFQNFVDAVEKLYDFKIKSQTKYFTSLPIDPEVINAGEDGEMAYCLRPHHLPHFINSAEWSFGGSVVSTAPPLNFVVYVPPHAQSPLYIMGHDQGFLKTNSFLIPQWGGISIVNPPKMAPAAVIHENGTTQAIRTVPPKWTLSSSDLSDPMHIFIYQMREILGVKTVGLGSTEQLLPGFQFNYESSSMGITKWELDRLARLTTIQNIRNAVNTLNSLITLIESMEDMVVQDHIREKVMVSLNAISTANAILSENAQETQSPAVNSSHDIALAASRAAIVAAERAFFDPTMVSLLYFPNEHKFAVYMPLFLPVGVPLVGTLVQEIKKRLQKRREGKTKTE